MHSPIDQSHLLINYLFYYILLKVLKKRDLFLLSDFTPSAPYKNNVRQCTFTENCSSRLTSTTDKNAPNSGNFQHM